MNYLYNLEHGQEDRKVLRETDLKVRMRMAREAQPNVPAGRKPNGPTEARA